MISVLDRCSGFITVSLLWIGICPSLISIRNMFKQLYERCTVIVTCNKNHHSCIGWITLSSSTCTSPVVLISIRNGTVVKLSECILCVVCCMCGNMCFCLCPAVKEKLTADPDSEIATTSLRVSLLCPVRILFSRSLG